jgi:hypothetical protein
MSGWVKLHRGIFDHWIASDPDYFCVWLRMLTDANFEDKKHLFNGSLIEIKRGQIIFGLEAWSAKTGVSISKLRRLLDMLEKDKMISRQKTNKYSLISITNYATYQDDDRQTASKPQADDKQTAIPKELKNIRSKEDNTLVDSGESPAEKVDFVSKEFDRFWRNYPTKKAKKPALSAFRSLVKNKRESQVKFYVDMILNYHLDCIARLEPGADALHAATLINQKRWEDDPEYIENFKREWIKENAPS